MNRSGRISILIPIYNVEAYLARCLNSALIQDYNNLEIILVDDGSVDSSREIGEQYSVAFSNIQYIASGHHGPSHARNLLLERMSGDFLFFLDADDFLSRNTISAMYQHLLKADVSVVQCKMQRTEKSVVNENEIKQEEKEAMISVYDNPVWDFQSGKTPLRTMVAGKLYRKEIWQDVIFPEGFIHEDEAVMHKVMYQAGKAATLSTPYYYYFQNRDSIMQKRFSYARYDIIHALEDRIEFLKGKELNRYALINRFRIMCEITGLHKQSRICYHDDEERKNMLAKIEKKYAHQFEILRRERDLPDELIDLIRTSNGDVGELAGINYWKTLSALDIE